MRNFASAETKITKIFKQPKGSLWFSVIYGVNVIQQRYKSFNANTITTTKQTTTKQINKQQAVTITGRSRRIKVSSNCVFDSTFFPFA